MKDIGIPSLFTMEWTTQANPLPVQNLTESAGPIELKSYSITEKDKNSFNERGYWVGPVVISPLDVAKLSSEFERIYQGQIDGNGSPYEYPRWKGMVDQVRKCAPLYKHLPN